MTTFINSLTGSVLGLAIIVLAAAVLRLSRRIAQLERYHCYYRFRAKTEGRGTAYRDPPTTNSCQLDCPDDHMCEWCPDNPSNLVCRHNNPRHLCSTCGGSNISDTTEYTRRGV